MTRTTFVKNKTKPQQPEKARASDTLATRGRQIPLIGHNWPIWKPDQWNTGNSGPLGLTHEVHDQLAYPGAEDEVPHEVGDEGEGDADDGHHQVADGQGQQEQVGHRPHAPVPHQDGDDEAVAQHAEEEDEAVEDDPHRLVDI